MQKLVIKGGRSLNGEVSVSGSKNASLPIISATLLAKGDYKISGLPKLRDISTMCRLTGLLGVKASCSKSSRFADSAGIYTIDDCPCDDITFTNSFNEDFVAPYELVKTMRASILVLGPLLAAKRSARVSLPGGCAIGARPVDMHINALKKMGADIKVSHGYINAKCKRLVGADITFRVKTVTGTENIMMAACLAEGRTVLNNAALEPEVVDLALFLKKMGAKIEGEGTGTIVIEGVDELKAADYKVMPDRIEAGTLMCAVAGCGGSVIIRNTPFKYMAAIIGVLKSAGVNIDIIDDMTLKVSSDTKLTGIDVTTMPYPGFPTDMQAQFMAIMCKACGISIIDETIFENRFMHVPELKRMGADISIKESMAVVKGVKELSGAQVMASDLRASAGLVIAGLMASNTSEIERIYHLDRGYESLEKKLASLGADIKRVDSTEN